MDDISRHLSVSKKTLYVEYKDKESLVLEVTKREMEKHLLSFDAIEKSADSALEELYLSSLEMRRTLQSMSPNLLFDLQKYHPAVWKVFRSYKENHFRAHLERILIRGVNEGVFRAAIHPKILSILRMKEAELCFDHQVYPTSDFDYREVQVVVLDHFIHGLLTDLGRSQWNTFRQESSLTS
jgi:AcrR family transcriptional regulator